MGEETQEGAEAFFRKISASNDALLAASIGTGLAGVSAIHDVAEGGVLSCMMELASASSLGMEIDPSQIPVSEETKAICGLFEIDPNWSLGEGALVITCNPRRASSLVDKLEQGGVKASIAGIMVDNNEGVHLLQNGKKIPLVRPAADPYWKAYYSAVAKKWN